MDYTPTPIVTRNSGKPPSHRKKGKSTRQDRFILDEEEDMEDEQAYAAAKRKRAKAKADRKQQAPATPLLLPEYITVSNLAAALRVKVEDLMVKLEDLGFEEMSHDHIMNAENAGLVSMEYNYEPIIDESQSRDLHPRPPPEDTSMLPHRPPVVTIMGHVDHGKTTLLDWLRKSSVAASEHGGITQHIGAFSVPLPSGKLITFLDTPGHAAFLSMRQRGANVTDIVVLVVAADDSVKPQTIEAINHAKGANVPMIVAINKIDKEDADPEKVKQDLSRNGVEIEDYGGDTQVICVSGKTGQGMGELEETIIALSEIIDMRAEINGNVEGWVLEGTTKKEGRVATVLVKRGTLHIGDIIVAGSTWARVRRLRNEAGITVDSVGPGTPIEIDGWREQPVSGDLVLQADNESIAKSVVDFRVERDERFRLALDMEAINSARRLEQEKRENQDSSNESASPDKTGGVGTKELNLIIKGDVFGSVEAVLDSVSALGNQEVYPKILRSGVGHISEFDIEHAATAKGHVIAFNISTEPGIARMAESLGVSILQHTIIYHLVDDVKARLSSMLEPLRTLRVTGEAEIAQIFSINLKGRTFKPIAGCKVRNGVIGRTSMVRVLRDKAIVYDGTLDSLKNVKKDVAEMRKGNECGMGFTDWTDFKIGDQVQTYETIIEPRTL
ncbi:MAG: hypothetical protein M1829_001371 [Trizodia sp. TS-e1964]|nr:MAG: hypothetical protein M1829_001371 [Trizodia sp. TS-e1964]